MAPGEATVTIRMIKKDNIVKVSVDGEMTIYTAVELKERLLDALHACNVIEIDLAGVIEMDTAGLQVLLLVRREAEHRNKTLRLNAHSPASLDVFKQYNISLYFGAPADVAAHGS